MPNYVSNVINNTPAASHNIYLSDLLNKFDPLVNNVIPAFQMKLSYGGHRVNKASNGSRAYIWDLYRLGYSASNNNREFGFFSRFPIISDPMFSDPGNLLGAQTNYFPLYCSQYTDNAGSSIYAQLKNFTKLGITNVPVFSNQKFTANLSFSPLFSTSRNVQYPAEALIYKATVIPFYPIICASSIPTHRTFGPAFVSRFSISVDGTDSLGDVQIQVSLVGGKSMISPTNLPAYKPFQNPELRTPMVDLYGNNLPETNFVLQNIGLPSSPFSSYYRPTNLSDCFFDASKFHSNYGSFVNFVRNNKNVNFRLINMTLNVEQNISFDYTMPGGDLLGTGSPPVYFGDVVGPRFAHLESREVTGSIKIFSYVNTSIINKNTTSLAMAFGPVYFYTIKNVDWSNPEISINPSGGYTHEYNFIARFGEFTTFYNSNNNRLVSEFWIQ